MVPIKLWIECLRKQIFNQLYCLESNIVRIKMVMLYCFLGHWPALQPDTLIVNFRT